MSLKKYTILRNMKIQEETKLRENKFKKKQIQDEISLRKKQF